MSTKKKIGFFLGFLVSLMLLVYGSGTALGTNTVHHQDCPEGWTQIVSQPPNSGFTVTAAYSGTLWIKVATIHFEVPVVTKGDVITPNDVSSWPTNRNGKFQAISHVDYCIPPGTTTTTTTTTTTVPVETTTTTLAPETTTTTLAPETTTTTTVPVETTTTTLAPETTTTTTYTVCIDTFDPELQDPNDPCSVPVTTVPEATTPPAVVTTVPNTPTTPTIMRLPETGQDAGYLAWIAAILLVGGISLIFASRRNRSF